jgi:hypothetical protein
MRKFLFVMALCVAGGNAMAQTGGAPSSGAPAGEGAASRGAAPPSPSAQAAPVAPDPKLPATSSRGTHSSADSARTGKNAAGERYADCMGLWDAGTHMSKKDWSRTCRRIENRLQNLQVENLNIDLTGPKPRKKGASPDAG